MKTKIKITYSEGFYGACSDEFPGCIAADKRRDKIENKYISCLDIHLRGMREDGETNLTLRDLDLEFEEVK